VTDRWKGWDVVNNQEKLAFVAKKVGYSSLKRYVLRSNFIFDGLKLEGARVLEIGCGNGAFCMWAALHGAEYVFGIEPEGNGSTGGTLRLFREVVEKLNLTNIEAKGIFLQELGISTKPFDIIVMYNVINHLDEDKVQILHKDQDAAEKYILLVRDLKKFLKPGGIIIVADCARRNFWNDIGLKSPLAPTIEWHKHQSPQQWIKIFKKAEYRLYDFRWSILNPIGSFASNWLVQYLTVSHFVLRFQSLEDGKTGANG